MNLVGNIDHNSGNPDLTNGPALGVVDEVEDVADILVEVGITENILAEEGVTLFVGDEGEAPAHQKLEPVVSRSHERTHPGRRG